MSSEKDPVAWLRAILEHDLKFWRGREAALAPGVEREGEYWWRDAQDRADWAEAALAILDEHAPRNGYDQPEGDLTPICVRCADDRMYGYAYPCRTVRLLASGYKHRPGYETAGWSSG